MADEPEVVKPDVGFMVDSDGQKYWVRNPELILRDSAEEDFMGGLMDAIRDEFPVKDWMRRNNLEIFAEQRLILATRPPGSITYIDNV